MDSVVHHAMDNGFKGLSQGLQYLFFPGSKEAAIAKRAQLGTSTIDVGVQP